MNVGALTAMALLLVANGFFVAAEFAFTAASRHELSTRRGRSARAAIAAIDELSFSLAGAQLGITICSLLLGYVAEPAVAQLLEAAIGAVVVLPAGLLHTVSFVIALSIVVFLHMVIGEMAPKNIAITDPEASSLVMALPFRAYSSLLRPVIYFLNGAANLCLRLFRIDPAEIGEAHTSDDLAAMISVGRREGVVEEFAHRVMTSAIDIGDLATAEVMVPRPAMLALPVSTPLVDLERTFAEAGYSRIPLYDRSLDDIVGFVHAKDMLAIDPADLDKAPSPEMLRQPLVVPESAPVHRVFEEMRRQRNHLALVIDEHGGVAGMVTMEDIIEEIVGEIRDEHDSDGEGVRRVSANRWVIDAGLRLDEVRRALGVELPEGDYETVGGLVMERIGRIPVVGDRIDEPQWTLRVRSMEGRRVGEVDVIVKRRKVGDE